MPVIQHDRLQGLIAKLLVANGASEEEAQIVSRHSVAANLAGHDSHGVIRIPRYVQWAKDGIQVPNQKLRVLSDQPGIAMMLR